LRAFCAAATMGSIAAAARSLHVSQPALSKRLRTLEAVAGTALFERSTRGVTLTPAGVHLYGAARRLLVSADTVHALMSAPPVATPVRLAASEVIADWRLPQVLSELAALETGLTVEVVAGNSPFVRELVRDGRCDLGIAAIDPDQPPEDGLHEKVLWRDEVVIAVPPAHPWMAMAEIPVEEFAGAALIEPGPRSSTVRLVVAALEHAGVTRAEPFASIGSAAGVVSTSLATGRPALVSLLPARQYEAQGLVVRRVEGMRFDREFALLWSGTVTALPGPVQAVAQHLLDLPFARSRRNSREFRDG